jgi:hypothetical protein
MKLNCSFCGKQLERPPSQFFCNGSKRNFCDFKCLSGFRKTQVGVGASRYKHGGKGTRIYRIWKSIKQRCRAKINSSSYRYYSGKGIRVCGEWAVSFEKFRDWSISHGYSENLCIDRINGNKNYCPENCRWVTPLENNMNTEKFKRTPDLIAKAVSLSSSGLSINLVAKQLNVSWPTAKRAIAGNVRWVSSHPKRKQLIK